MITVLCPTHRPHEVSRVVHQFAQQTYPSKRLVMIENGPAVGACLRRGLSADAVLKSGHNKSAAMLAGLQWLRQHGGGAWALWDDDDYYGPSYLEEAITTLPGHDASGKHSIFMRLSNGRLWHVERGGPPLGHSFVAWSDCVDPPQTDHVNDDDQWRRAMLAAGASWGVRSDRHFIWNRRNPEEHLWKANDTFAAHMLKPHVITDHGYRPDKFADAVERCPGSIVELPSFDALDAPGVPEEFKREWSKE